VRAYDAFVCSWIVAAPLTLVDSSADRPEEGDLDEEARDLWYSVYFSGCRRESSEALLAVALAQSTALTPIMEHSMKGSRFPWIILPC
jgi:hypothetical protein